jgi:hypothetical protein
LQFGALVVFFIAVMVYRSNTGYLNAYDSAPTTLAVFNALEHQTLAFDEFRNGYLVANGAGYVFLDAPNGHLESQYPIGTTLLTAPIYLVQYAVDQAKHALPDILSPAFEPTRLRDEKRAAILVGSLAAMLFFLCALRITTLEAAIVATIAFAFGSEMWTIGSQALWQHGALALVTLAMILALLRVPNGERRGLPLLLAGLCAGFLPVVRPTAIIYGTAGLAFAMQYGGRERKRFFAGFAIGIAPGLLWNVAIFHSAFGGYQVASQSYIFTFVQAVSGFEGLLVSPNRGLLIFMPWVVFCALGVYRAFVQASPIAHLLRYLTIATIATFANYIFFANWHGGSNFGPRYLTDLMPTLGLLVAYAWPALRLRAPARRAALGALIVTIAFAVAVQAAGAYAEPITNWSGTPLDLTRHTERIWQWHDSQIERDALATYHLWAPNPTFRTSYADGYDGTIGAISLGDSILGNAPVHVAPGETVSLRAELTNTGTSLWYGYDTGMYFGQTHVRVRFIDAAGAIASERSLYVAGETSPNMHAIASAIVSAPSTAGRYKAVFDIDVLQDARIGSRHVGARSLTFDVEPGA